MDMEKEDFTNALQRLALDRGYNFIHSKSTAPRKKGKGKGNKKGGKNFGGNNTNTNDGGFHPGGTHNAAQKAGQFSFDTIHGLKLREMDYTVPPLTDRRAKRDEFNGGRDQNGKLNGGGVRGEFLKMLANEHEAELVEKLGLTDRDLESMRDGYTPNGFNVHHKLSLHGGGTNDFSNFILTPLYPHDQWHKDIIDGQLIGIKEGETRTIMVPWTDEMIYDPKKYGFTKDNQKVTPNYSSNVDETGYLKLYRPEHIDVEKRQKDMASHYAEIDAKKRQKADADKLAAVKHARQAKILDNKRRR